MHSVEHAGLMSLPYASNKPYIHAVKYQYYAESIVSCNFFMVWSCFLKLGPVTELQIV